MGKGDKKTRRGKIILGTYGVRRRRKRTDKPGIKLVTTSKEKDLKEKKLKEKREVKEARPVKEVIPVVKEPEAAQPAEIKEAVPVVEAKDIKRLPNWAAFY